MIICIGTLSKKSLKSKFNDTQQYKNSQHISYFEPFYKKVKIIDQNHWNNKNQTK